MTARRKKHKEKIYYHADLFLILCFFMLFDWLTQTWMRHFRKILLRVQGYRSFHMGQANQSQDSAEICYLFKVVTLCVHRLFDN